MSDRHRILGAGLALAAALGMAAASSAQAEPAQRGDSCFLAAQWSDWKSPSPNVIYLKVNLHQVYRLDLASGSNELQAPDVHLVSTIRGSDWICSPLDLQLEVSDLNGFREPLIVKAITPLTPDEIQAIPAKYRP